MVRLLVHGGVVAGVHASSSSAVTSLFLRYFVWHHCYHSRFIHVAVI